MEIELISNSDVSEHVRLVEARAANQNMLRFGVSSSSPRSDAPELWESLPESAKFDVVFSVGMHSAKSVEVQLNKLVLNKKLNRVRHQSGGVLGFSC